MKPIRGPAADWSDTLGALPSAQDVTETAPALTTAATRWVLLALTTRAFSVAADQNDARERAGAQSFLMRAQQAIAQTMIRGVWQSKACEYDALINKAWQETGWFALTCLFIVFGCFLTGILPAPIGPSIVFDTILPLMLGLVTPLVFVSIVYWHFRCHRHLRHDPLLKRWWRMEQSRAHAQRSKPIYEPTLTETEAFYRPRSNPASGLPLTSGGLDMGGNPNGSRH